MRLRQISGEEKYSAIFEEFKTPPLGSDPSLYPACTLELLNRLSSFIPQEKVIEALTGNHHRIPVERFNE